MKDEQFKPKKKKKKKEKEKATATNSQEQTNGCRLRAKGNGGREKERKVGSFRTIPTAVICTICMYVCIYVCMYVRTIPVFYHVRIKICNTLVLKFTHCNAIALKGKKKRKMQRNKL